jgi:UDP-N-acetylglucosamine 4-epimerase
MNMLSIKTERIDALNTVYNTAFGERTTLDQLVNYLKEYLTGYDPEIAHVNSVYGPPRTGDIAHSLASIEKAKNILGYDPQYNVRKGLKESIKWYWDNLK